MSTFIQHEGKNYCIEDIQLHTQSHIEYILATHILENKSTKEADDEEFCELSEQYRELEDKHSDANAELMDLKIKVSELREEIRLIEVEMCVQSTMYDAELY